MYVCCGNHLVTNCSMETDLVNAVFHLTPVVPALQHDIKQHASEHCESSRVLSRVAGAKHMWRLSN